LLAPGCAGEARPSPSLDLADAPGEICTVDPHPARATSVAAAAIKR
jgi:hypothetical protein